MTDVNKILTGVFGRIAGLRDEQPTAGTRFRLMGLVADIAEVTGMLQQQVLQRVSQEAVLDVDVDVDYAELSEQVLTMELEESEQQDEAVREQTHAVNEGLGALSSVLVGIAEQLERNHKDEEFARLYEQEKRRYMNSGTSKRARQTFEQWKNYECYGHPLQENIEDYRTEKLVHMFEKGVFNTKVDHIQRAKRYPGEVDFDQLDDDHKLKKTVYKHYAALRKLVDYRDGCLVVNPVRVGQYFYAGRKEENAKALRNAFLKYMHKIDLAQEELKRLQAAQKEAARTSQDEVEELNFFAPAKNLKVLLQEDWFGVLTTNEERYNQQWTERFVEALMHSELGEHIAREWSVKDKRLTLKCMVIGVLKDVGVLRGSYNQIAKLLEMDGENPATLAKYMGQGKKQPFADWIEEYVNSE